MALLELTLREQLEVIMPQLAILFWLLTPMAYAIGVIQIYKDYHQTTYDQRGQFLYRLSVDGLTEHLPDLPSRKLTELLNLNRLQSQSTQISAGLFETRKGTIRFAKGNFSGGDLLLFDAHVELLSGRISSPEVRIRLTDLQMTARRAMRFDTRGKMIAYQRFFHASLY